nr:DUF3362 domain-containing protein [Rhodospira trueperi]
MATRRVRERRPHTAFPREHDPENSPLLRDALKRPDRADLIGPGKRPLPSCRRISPPAHGSREGDAERRDHGRGQT